MTAVLLAFRAFDTFLEKVVLLLALIGVWSLAADGHWGARTHIAVASGPRRSTDFSRQDPSASGDCCRPLRILDRCGSPWGRLSRRRNSLGHVAPGDVGRRRERAPVEDAALRLALVAGAALFLATGLAGFWVADAFLAYPEGYAKALIIGIEAAMTVSVAATLALLVAGPPARGVRR